MKVKLTKKEYASIMEEGFLPENLRAAMGDAVETANTISFVCPEEVSDEIRDLCCERLQEVGFDENYNPNEMGQILESLIDKLYLG